MPQRARDPEPPPPTPPSGLRELFSADAVAKRIDELATEIAVEFRERRPLFIVIAEGARRFAAAIAQGLAARGVPSDELIVRARRTSGVELHEVTLEAFDAVRCAGRDLLLLDDIADEGRTLDAVLARVRASAPRTVRTAVLVSKHSRRRMKLPLDHVGFQIEDGWVVGFGMDLDGRYRELEHLAVLVGR